MFATLSDGGGALPPDPTVTDPDKYKVILENDQVRVIDYHDRPGESTKQHHHRPFMLYVLSPFRRKLTFPDGTTKEREFKTGEVFWMNEQTHVGKNVGTTESHALLVEPKSGDGSAAKADPKPGRGAAAPLPGAGGPAQSTTEKAPAKKNP